MQIINETQEVICGYSILDDLDTSFVDSPDPPNYEDTEEYLQMAASPSATTAAVRPPSSSGACSSPATSGGVVTSEYEDHPRQALPTDFSIGDLLLRPRGAVSEQPRRSSFVSWAVAPACEPDYTVPFIGPVDEAPVVAPLLASPAETLQPPEPPLPVSNAEMARLVSLYIQETGTWCETTDSDMQFTMRSIHEMMRSPAFTAAVMALASRQLDHVGHRPRPITLELYQYTIQLLLQQDPAKQDASALATCTLLCVYEMMASDVYEWRRHLKVSMCCSLRS